MWSVFSLSKLKSITVEQGEQEGPLKTLSQYTPPFNSSRNTFQDDR